MIDGDTEDMARNAAASAREAANKGYNAAREYAGNSYDAAREYANANSGLDVAGRVSENLRDLCKKSHGSRSPRPSPSVI
jgi:formylglycine-generating enzyme required for sulfatase activity